jgi:hypothetical protein
MEALQEDKMVRIAAQADRIASEYPEEVQDFVRTLMLEHGLISLGKREADHLKYESYQELVLDLGSVRKAELILPAWCQTMEAQQCYLNSYRLATENEDLTYCEGYALHSYFRVPHAWVVDQDGRIIDPTWTGLAEPQTHAYYAGVKFDTDFLVLHADETGWVSMFATDWQRDAEMLTLGFVMDNDIAIGMGEL